MYIGFSTKTVIIFNNAMLFNIIMGFNEYSCIFSEGLERFLEYKIIKGQPKD